MSKPVVSVIMITYGHENFIEEAIKGVFIQQTTFPVQLIIADDCSPDNTGKVVYKLSNKAPKHITVAYTKHVINKGAAANFIWALEQATGKYIALCEGDDYWTDPLKLQKQVDFLEENEAYGLVCTNYNTSEHNPTKTTDKEITLANILSYSAIGTLTVVFKAEVLTGVKGEIFSKQFSMGDYQLWLYFSSVSKIWKLGDVTAYYRILENSASGRNNIAKKVKFDLDALEITKFYLRNSNLTTIEKRSILRERYGHLFSSLLKKKDKSFFKYQWLYFKDVKKLSLLDIKILINGYKIYL